MLKKIFITIIILNICLFIWQSILGISLSTQGDVLNADTFAVESLKNEIDLMDSKIAMSDSLVKISLYASQKGFVPATLVRYSADNLAVAKIK